MPTVIVDGRELSIAAEERLNGIQAASRLGIEIPHYCWHPGLSVVASCRMCLVEAGRRDPETGEVQLQPKLVPACQTPATHGTVFVTNSEKVRQARAMVEEDLLLRHPIDCPICDKAGECYLQDYHFKYGQAERRADIRPFTSRRRPVGETVTLFVDRCVMCSRCVRFTREISGTHELMIVNRGSHEEIDIFPGYPLANKLSGNVVDLCPVGALGDTDFLYSQRVWFMQHRPHVCAGCSTGCAIFVDENQDRIYRIKPRENPHVNQWWICDEGRYGFKYIHDRRRLTQIHRAEHNGQTSAIGAPGTIDWSRVPAEIEQLLSHTARLAVICSPFLTVEEGFLLACYARLRNPTAEFVLGPVPRVGQDEIFPKGFTIRAEKAPNRLGIAQVLAHFDDRGLGFDAWLEQLQPSADLAVWIAGGYPEPPWSVEQVRSLRQAGVLIVQELFPSDLTQGADLCLPSAAFAERAGSFVNHGHRLQTFDWAIRPPTGVMTEGQWLWRALGRSGLYRPANVLREVAEQISYFSPVAGGVPDVGIDLRVQLLAQV